MKTTKEIAELHFITIDHPDILHSDQAIRAYKAGCKWVQLRMKNASLDEIEKEVVRILPVAKTYNAVLLINDHTEIVLRTGAHGVHLGKNDMSPSMAREMLGHEYFIGGTANTLEEVLYLIENGVDYVGLGPYRFTTTKKNLSPTLGKQGYAQIITALNTLNLKIPIIAIGGILENDLQSLMQTGIHGIAAAGAIVAGNAIETNVQNYQQLIHLLK
ncbi:MAG TPA: thiamine phosphate synthase [Paludibacter sp.]